jgi:hypothetical protein
MPDPASRPPQPEPEVVLAKRLGWYFWRKWALLNSLTLGAFALLVLLLER